MKFLCVLAHPEPSSFTAGLARYGLSALRAAGHEADLIDLYAEGFDPVSDRRNFIAAADPVKYDQQLEERHASTTAGYTSELQSQMDRLAACDALVLQFPIWWLGMPAILKGWIDRVFAIGVTYGGGRWFDRGMMRGKLAMLAVTIGGPEQAYSGRGIYGPVRDVLRPINHGILAFCGFDVIEPFLAYSPARKSEQERKRAFNAYADRLLNLDAAPRLTMLRSSDYEHFVRKCDSPA
jgi:NAD(P)H dehydrogenase (quinone)